jgi:hypothetical protein
VVPRISTKISRFRDYLDIFSQLTRLRKNFNFFFHSSEKMQICGGEGMYPKYCSGPPDIPTDIDVNNSDRCYLYQAIGQGETSKAIQWLNLWKDTSLTNSNDRDGVIWKCIIHKNEELIQYFYSNGITSVENVQRLRQSWKS